MVHVPVLAGEAIQWLGVRGNGVYVDGTTGVGGHSAAIAERLTTGRLVALDRDPAAVRQARERLRTYPNVTVVHANYSSVITVLEQLNIDRVDGVLIDAGVSSMQLDEAARGFSFQRNGVLDMRMDTSAGPTAAEYINAVPESELVRVLRDYGDLRAARRIARAICETRSKQLIQTTGELARAVSDLFPYVSNMPDEVRRVFQAIRIAVNDELKHLEHGLEAALSVLAPGGRLVVITFHSGEDRIAKNFFRAHGQARKELHPDGRVKHVVPPELRILTRKPITPSEAEIQANPRSHSAKLRAAERLNTAEGA